MSTTTITTTDTQHLTSIAPSSTPQWRGKLRFIPPGQTPQPSPHNFHLPEMKEFGDVRIQSLIDMRPVPTMSELLSSSHANQGQAQLPTHGFAAIRYPTTMNSAPYGVSSWKDPSVLKGLYIPETEEMVKRVTGAKTVITEALILRSEIWSEADGLATHAGHGDQKDGMQNPAPAKTKEEEDLEMGFPQFIGFSPGKGGVSPAPKVHLDFAPNGARLHLRKYHPTLTAGSEAIIEAEEKLLAEGKSLRDEYALSGLGPRWALYSIWRPLKRVRRDPLALGDARTFQQADYVPVVVKTPNLGVVNGDGPGGTHDAESYLARWSSGQKWYFISQQEPEEVLVIGLFDSERDSETVAAGGTLHSSVDLEGTEDEEARESVELRCLAIW